MHAAFFWQMKPRAARAGFSPPLWPLLALALAATAHACRAQNPGPRPAPATARAQLEQGTAVHPLALELACSAQQHARGLMGRTSLGPADGMLFAFADEAPRTFWMHDTPLPLDLLFFAADGAVTCIIDAAAPNTDTPRPCALNSAYVVELPGGTAASWRIGPGARLRVPPHAYLCPP